MVRLPESENRLSGSWHGSDINQQQRIRDQMELGMASGILP
jgi:hypothetical protein